MPTEDLSKKTRIFGSANHPVVPRANIIDVDGQTPEPARPLNRTLVGRLISMRRWQADRRHSQDLASASTMPVEPVRRPRVSGNPGKQLVLRPETRPAYAEYQEMGLAPAKQPGALSPARLVVNVYRLVGFAILTLVVALLVGYIGTSVFYFTNTSWVQPMVVSPTDDRVLQLRGKLAEQENLRDQVASEISHTERAIAVQTAFQRNYEKALKTDLSDRRARLRQLRQLSNEYAGTRRRIKDSNSALAAVSGQRIDQEFEAGLIDKDGYLQRNQGIAQLENSNLSLLERQSQLEAQTASIAAEARALDAALQGKRAGPDASGSLSYDVLRIKQDYEMSVLETAKAKERLATLKASLARYQGIVDTVAQSAYLRAADERSTVAFVPYDNLGGVEAGTVLYGCRLEMLWCRPVGKVVDKLAGEVTHKHPHRAAMLRGQLLELQVDDPMEAEKDVLFVGRAPLFI